MTQSSYCSKCGGSVEADCDFCPNCGEPKLRVSESYQSPSTGYPWMQEPVQPPPPQQPQKSRPVVASQYIPPPPQQQQIHHVVYQQVEVAPGHLQDTGLGKAGQTMGIIAISVMVVGLIPCLGWINWINIPFSFVTWILSIVAISTAKLPTTRSKATVGLVLGLIAWIIGIIRLSLGMGCV